MRITVRSKTLGGHTHCGIWVNGGKSCDDLCLRNEDVADFLARLQPQELIDETPEGHTRVAFPPIGFSLEQRARQMAEAALAHLPAGTARYNAVRELAGRLLAVSAEFVMAHLEEVAHGK